MLCPNDSCRQPLMTLGAGLIDRLRGVRAYGCVNECTVGVVKVRFV